MSSKFYAHTISARKAYERSRALMSLGELPGGLDLFEVLRDHILVEGTKWDDGTEKRSARHHGVIGEVKELPGRRLHGRVYAGASGIRSDIDLEDGTQVARQLQDVERRPLYFLLNLPAKTTKGLLLVEQHGHLGVRGAFWDNMVVKGMRRRHKEILVDIAHYYPSAVWQEYERLGGELTQSTLITRLRPPIADNNLDGAAPDTDYLGQLKVGIERDYGRIAKDRIVALLRGDMAQPEAIELLLPSDSPDTKALKQLETHEVSVNLKLTNGATRTVTLGTDSMPRVGYDLPDDLSVDDQGYPSVAAMRTEAANLEKILLPPLGLTA